MKSDGNAHNLKSLCKRGTNPHTLTATSEHRATVLPIVNGNGDPVCCAIIYASKKDKVYGNWATGIDVRVTPIKNDKGQVDILNMDNYGPGKYFPGGPECNVNGKKIPTLTYTSPNGSITSEILVNILLYFDNIGLYNRNHQERDPSKLLPTPLFIIDGHQSRFSPNFLEYVNNELHKWGINFGVPYKTELWQIGDSSEGNGMFKSNWYLAKQDLLRFKIEKGMPLTIEATDIIPLVNIAWSKSFARADKIRNAIADRGWNPANRKLLTHPEILKTKTVNDEAQEEPNNQHQVEATGGPEDVIAATETTNIENSTPNRILGAMYQQLKRKGGEQKRLDNLSQGQSIAQSLKEARALTAGVIVTNRIFDANNPTMLAEVRDREERKQKADRKSVV